MIDKIKETIETLPDTVKLAGFAINRSVFINDKLMNTGTEYNWGYIGAGTSRLAHDILRYLYIYHNEATILSTSLGVYILSALADNFIVNIAIKRLFQDALIGAVKDGNDYIEIISEETPDYIEISKNNLQPGVSELPYIDQQPVTEESDSTTIVSDEKGWRRVMKNPDKNNARSIEVGKMIDAFRETT